MAHFCAYANLMRPRPTRKRHFIALACLILCGALIWLHPTLRAARAPMLTETPLRVLVTDMMFPNALAAWRLNSMQAMIEHTRQTLERVPGNYSFDWAALRESHHLAAYDLLIFNPAYNHLNWVNALDRGDGLAFDGTVFNGHWPAEYMLRLRKYSREPLTTRVYDAFYHIFVYCYMTFAREFSGTPQGKHFVHWYPGGGFVWANNSGWNYGVHGDATLISTQAFTTEYLARVLPSSTMLRAYGGPFLQEQAELRYRERHGPGQPLVVCFTSLGAVAEKGADHFVAIAEAFTQRFPSSHVKFIGIGNVTASPAVRSLPAMPQASLNDFYRRSIDIIFNLDRTNNLHGWPLGCEAVVHGALLFSTDVNGMNELNDFHFADGFFRVVEGNISATVARLHAYALDRQLLQEHSKAIQFRAHSLFGFSRQMGQIIGEMRKQKS